jgi:predicted RNase H-like HicB family nuclease
MDQQYTFAIVLGPDIEEDGYSVVVPALPGCVTQGETRDDAIAAAREAIALHVASLLADGLPVPVEHVPVEAHRVTVGA